ncbi:hypothetical protein [Thermoleophilum album]|uniref:hypothetical protein n=1 Tax=Thermoleophilum album TaxID=29539 RepID=UPI00115FF03C|nr:hypothetical protein [Thermoleophilum album]
MLVEIKWHANTFRGDELEAHLKRLAPLALEYGARWWLLYRALEAGLDFVQLAEFDRKEDFDRYWYSDEVGAIRERALGTFQVPLIPSFHQVVGRGELHSPEELLTQRSE